jgi:hypothetical protein
MRWRGIQEKGYLVKRDSHYLISERMTFKVFYCFIGAYCRREASIWSGYFSKLSKFLFGIVGDHRASISSVMFKTIDCYDAYIIFFMINIEGKIFSGSFHYFIEFRTFPFIGVAETFIPVDFVCYPHPSPYLEEML